MRTKTVIKVGGLAGVMLFLTAFCVLFGALGVSLYGLYLAFSASIIVGIMAMIVEPAPLFLGLVQIFFDRNLAQELVNWLRHL